jgi:hypothetical protein
LLQRKLVPLALTIVLAACAEGGFRSGDCATPQVRLAELGIDPSDIQSIEQYVERGPESTVLRRDGWVKLKSCDGYVVVRLDTSCGPAGSAAYTTGNCRLPERRGG